MRAALVCLAAFACGRDHADATPSPPRRPTPAAVVAPVEPKAPASPHGGTIGHVAITDEGDAAVTSDEIGGMRLWPALDGKQEPRVIASASPRHLAIAHAGAELVVAIVDAAGGLELRRYAPGGAAHGRSDVPPEPGFDQIAPLGDGVLALARDQSVTWFDARGAVRGRLAADAGERIAAIATRRGAAIASFDSPAGPTVVRAIELAPALHWGPRIALPQSVRAISLSPSHTRVAAVAIAGGDGVIFELRGAARRLGSASLVAALESKAWSGFLDDDHAVFATELRTGWWPALGVIRGDGATTEPAVGDGHCIEGAASEIALVEPTRARYLGYKNQGTATAAAIGQHMVLNFGLDMLWLDDRLHELGQTGARTNLTPVLALDDHLYLATKVSGAGPDLAIVDLDTGKDRVILSGYTMLATGYDPAARALALQFRRKSDMTDDLERLTIDAHGETHDARWLHVTATGYATPADPKAAHGLLAVSLLTDNTGAHLLAFREDPKVGPDGQLAAATSVPIDGVMLGMSRTGTAYLAEGDRIAVVRDGAIVTRLHAAASAGAVSHDGTRLALIDGKGVFATDATGAELWRRVLWRASAAAFLADDKEIIVTTQGGFLALDAATGATLATGCGWHFGIHDELANATFNTETVCE